MEITGTCNPFNCRGGFSLHVSTETRDEFQILSWSNAKIALEEFISEETKTYTLLLQCEKFSGSIRREKWLWFHFEVACAVSRREEFASRHRDLVTFGTLHSKRAKFQYVFMEKKAWKMSRRSSVSSSVSTSVKSGVEDDPLMRDCYDLRRRLLQTEQSLQSLNPPHATNG